MANMPSAFKIDKKGFVVFDIDKKHGAALVDYLFEDAFNRAEEDLKIKLPSEYRDYVRTHHAPSTAYQFILRDMERFRAVAGTTSP